MFVHILHASASISKGDEHEEYVFLAMSEAFSNYLRLAVDFESGVDAHDMRANVSIEPSVMLVHAVS